MRLSRLVAAVAATLTVALGGLIDPTPAVADGGLPYGYVARDYSWPSISAECHLHAYHASDVTYKPVLWVNAIVVYDGILAEGDWCRIGNYYLDQHYSTLQLLKYGRALVGDAMWCMCEKDPRAYNSSYSYFQGFDGNFVSYDANGAAVGATDTCCVTAQDAPWIPLLALQSDGNLVVYRYNTSTHVYNAKWATNTAGW